ncbi:zinc-dependent alcohol dehydrogenase family protein [Alteraurantiacibacter aquimixticola]|uniref:NAD(P)-dependent alcohol dehydrogenase n=1 Tax=Alteraurantiacibacter aquimixticola TaxID=2489173 RepID=A0A4T3F2I9_9SPHN|nr:NAD(P)-dependent alcohol dehydrogenase [Alteraurantiacibacter aquimixticola]TIX48820.1 NAD(P)-dependent alcohol dehydrogenase [Alteraurantiacibacter aquimixticola]
MRAWMLPAGSDGFEKLYMEDLPDPEPGPGEVLIAPKAWSINYRDFAVASGHYFGGALQAPAIPLSDGAGVVLAVGEGVTSVKPGDRVQGSFFLDWIDGPHTMGRALGDGHGPGMLAEKVVLPAQAVVKMADSLDFSQAACLPCAGVTAWNALTRGRPVKAGDKVLVLGTGGVSMIALQLAKAMGAEVIATSSSDEKLGRVKDLGADHTINYKETPQWGAAVKEQFGGADKIVEVGGTGTLGQSIAALANEGEIALIGVLSQGEPPSPHGLMMTGGSIRGIFVGSVQMAKDLNAFVDRHKIEPPIGGRYAFDQAPKAYAHGWGADSFGKTVIEM